MIYSKSSWIYLKKACVIFAISAGHILVSSCATAPLVEPDRTTYPRDLRTTSQVRIPILPGDLGVVVQATGGDKAKHQDALVGRPSLEFEQTTVGDTAMQEVGIVPTADRGPDEASLRKAIPEVAPKLCGGRYRVVDSKYYLGTEATSRFMSIRHPWLKITVRCPLDISSSQDRLVKNVLSLSEDIPESDYFDVHQKNYDTDIQQLKLTLHKILEARDMKVIDEKENNGSISILTDRSSRGVLGFPSYEQLVAILTPKGNGSIFAFQLLVYDRDFEGTSDATGMIRLTPSRRNFAYRRASTFVTEMATYLAQK